MIENGTVPVKEVFDNLRSLASNQGIMDFQVLSQCIPQPRLDGDRFALFRIGDALSSRDVPAAMFDALRLCCRL